MQQLANHKERKYTTKIFFWKQMRIYSITEMMEYVKRND